MVSLGEALTGWRAWGCNGKRWGMRIATPYDQNSGLLVVCVRLGCKLCLEINPGDDSEGYAGTYAVFFDWQYLFQSAQQWYMTLSLAFTRNARELEWYVLGMCEITQVSETIGISHTLLLGDDGSNRYPDFVGYCVSKFTRNGILDVKFW